jgi:hypothetical protein
MIASVNLRDLRDLLRRQARAWSRASDAYEAKRCALIDVPAGPEKTAAHAALSDESKAVEKHLRAWQGTYLTLNSMQA